MGAAVELFAGEVTWSFVMSLGRFEVGKEGLSWRDEEKRWRGVLWRESEGEVERMEVAEVVLAMVEEGGWVTGVEEMKIIEIAWFLGFQWLRGLVTWHFSGQLNFIHSWNFRRIFEQIYGCPFYLLYFKH